jgi:hypothetical protein
MEGILDDFLNIAGTVSVAKGSRRTQIFSSGR